MMRCSYCHDPIGVMDGIRLGGFCSPAHQEMFHMREWLVARGVHGFLPPAIRPRDGWRVLTKADIAFAGVVQHPVHAPEAGGVEPRRSGLLSCRAKPLEGPSQPLSEPAAIPRPAPRNLWRLSQIDSAVHAIGERFQRWMQRSLNSPALRTREQPPEFCAVSCALPPVPAPPVPPRALAAVPPAAWKPWRAGQLERWSRREAAVSNAAPFVELQGSTKLTEFRQPTPAISGLGLVQLAPRAIERVDARHRTVSAAAPTIEHPASAALPEFTPSPPAAFSLGLVQLANRGPAQPDLPKKLRSASESAALRAPKPLVRALSVALRSVDSRPFRKLGGDEFFQPLTCSRGAIMAPRDAIAIPAISVRPPKAARIGDNVVVMPSGRPGGAGQSFAYQPPAAAFREHRVTPLAERALPVLLLTPQPFPVEATA